MHDWNVSPKEAIEIQKKLQSSVVIKPLKKDIKYIAGADISLNRFAEDIYAGIIVLSYPELEPVTYSVIQSKTMFPYIPGLLSFREIPTLLEVWDQLKIKPDLVVVDGQGIAHPRRLGIASHFGALLNISTIGCAKSILYGIHKEPEISAGSFSYLYSKDEPAQTIGTVLRTKDNVKPVIISPGHNIDISQSLKIMQECVRGYRIPEPTRQAHELVNKFRKGEIEQGYKEITKQTLF